MNTNMLFFYWGATMMASLAVALFLFKFWRDTRDRLFALFSWAFVLLAAERIVLSMFDEQSESQSYIYILRILAFFLILLGIIHKNRGLKGI